MSLGRGQPANWQFLPLPSTRRQLPSPRRGPAPLSTFSRRVCNLPAFLFLQADCPACTSTYCK